MSFPLLLRLSILLFLGGCTWTMSRPDADSAPPRPQVPPRAAVIQTHGGDHPHWIVCTQDCPAPTPKSRPGATSTAPSIERTAAAPDATPIATGSAPEPARIEVAERPPTPPQAPQPYATLIVHFAVGSARLDADALGKLNRALPGLQRAAALRIAGRTDDTGSLETNNALAQARALAVIEWLRVAERGIGASWTSQSQGACCYLVPNDTAAGRATNRRVEIELYAKAPAPRNPSSS
jgi:outer membrane protein OmpA-like peptidoglycan-associated protein